MLVSAEFERCCRAFESYPFSLIQQDLDVCGVKKCHQTIAQSTPLLLTSKDSFTEVWFRDFHVCNNTVEKKEKRLCRDLEIVDWLGDSTQGPNLGSIPPGKVATCRDPQCRIVYMTAPSSRSALKITKRSLTRILTFHQVMPAYFDLVSNIFGYSEGEVNPTYFAFRDRVFLDGADQGHRMLSLGRSGRHYQLAYTLKTIASSSKASQAVANQEWSIRPAAFYHQFDIETGAALWLTTHGRPDLYKQISETTDLKDLSVGSAVPDDFRCTLRMHLMHASWASEGWQRHIEWFEEMIKNETHLAVYGSSRDLYEESSCNTEQLGRIQILEEKLNESINVIEGNCKIIKALRSFYVDLSKIDNFSDEVARRNDLTVFDKELEKTESDFETVLTRAKHQSKFARDRKSLVLLQVQDRNIVKTENIALDTRKITIKAQHEAVVMRIFTAVTLVYLPATFVSTFFSTDVIKYQGAVNFSLEALVRWMQVTLPLTLITLLVAGYFFYKSYRTAKNAEKFVPRAVIRMLKPRTDSSQIIRKKH